MIVRHVDPADFVAIEAAENFARRSFTPSEAVAIARALEPRLRAEAAERQRAGRPSAKFAGGETRRMSAAPTGFSHETLRKAEAIVQAAQAQPERFGRLLEEMDRTGRVEGVHKQLRVTRERENWERRRRSDGETIADLHGLLAAGRRFGLLYADPPWVWEVYSPNGRTLDQHYGQMTAAQIATLPIAELAAEDSVLLLWTTWPRLLNSIQVIEAWGFEYKTLGFLWVKTTLKGVHWGNGYWTRSNSEPCLLATRGAPHRMAFDVHQVVDVPEIVTTPVGAHSVKPSEVHERIERGFPGPYLELFARKPRPGWTVWGDEIPPPPLPE